MCQITTTFCENRQRDWCVILLTNKPIQSTILTWSIFTIHLHFLLSVHRFLFVLLTFGRHFQFISLSMVYLVKKINNSSKKLATTWNTICSQMWSWLFLFDFKWLWHLPGHLIIIHNQVSQVTGVWSRYQSFNDGGPTTILRQKWSKFSPYFNSHFYRAMLCVVFAVTWCPSVGYIGRLYPDS